MEEAAWKKQNQLIVGNDIDACGCSRHCSVSFCQVDHHLQRLLCRISTSDHCLFCICLLCPLFLQLGLSDADLVHLAAAGRLLMARPYGVRMNHKDGLASCYATAQVCTSG